MTLKELIHARGVTIKDFAAGIGVNQRTLEAYTSGRRDLRNASAAISNKIATGLDLSCGQLFSKLYNDQGGNVMAKMQRYFDLDKDVLWEHDFQDSLYGGYAGTKGLYRSRKDGKHFYAEHYTNQLQYSGRDRIVIIPEDVALAALAKKYLKEYDGEYHMEADPEYYLINARYLD